MKQHSGWILAVTCLVAGCSGGSGSSGGAPKWAFQDVTASAQLTAVHVHGIQVDEKYEEIGGGAGAGDVDGNGTIDLLVAGGPGADDQLFLNDPPGTFTLASPAQFTPGPRGETSGPTLADVDGDGDLDALIGYANSNEPGKVIFFRNGGSGNFVDATVDFGLDAVDRPVNSTAFGDYDLDGDLDLFFGLWGAELVPGESTQHLWNNNGNGGFTDVSIAAGIAAQFPRPSATQVIPENIDFSFAPHFADLDGDRYPELLVTSDFGTSFVLRNNTDGTFSDMTQGQLTDQFGMGASVQDYDYDGDLDWFVTSIDSDVSSQNGNRLYRNDNGQFTDVSESAGVREGEWGWASCMQDLNLDGHLDIYHVNGYDPRGSNRQPTSGGPRYTTDPARLFVNNGDGTFREEAKSRGAADTGIARGLVCFDYDRDGDIDLYIANREAPGVLYANNFCDTRPCNWLNVILRASSGNTHGIGAWITLETSQGSQLRVIHAGNNFVSQDPAEAHFGLGDAEVERVVVQWADGFVSTVEDPSVNRQITVTR